MYVNELWFTCYITSIFFKISVTKLIVIIITGLPLLAAMSISPFWWIFLMHKLWKIIQLMKSLKACCFLVSHLLVAKWHKTCGAMCCSFWYFCIFIIWISDCNTHYALRLTFSDFCRTLFGDSSQSSSSSVDRSFCLSFSLTFFPFDVHFPSLYQHNFQVIVVHEMKTCQIKFYWALGLQCPSSSCIYFQIWFISWHTLMLPSANRS